MYLHERQRNEVNDKMKVQWWCRVQMNIVINTCRCIITEGNLLINLWMK